MSSETVTDFTTVDSSNDPEFFLRFLDAANRLPTVATSKQMILDGLRLRTGSRVLDLGCGLGDDTFQIAEAGRCQRERDGHRRKHQHDR